MKLLLGKQWRGGKGARVARHAVAEGLFIYLVTLNNARALHLYSRPAAAECTGVEAGWIRLVTPGCSETIAHGSELNIHATN